MKNCRLYIWVISPVHCQPLHIIQQPEKRTTELGLYRTFSINVKIITRKELILCFVLISLRRHLNRFTFQLSTNMSSNNGILLYINHNVNIKRFVFTCNDVFTSNQNSLHNDKPFQTLNFSNNSYLSIYNLFETLVCNFPRQTAYCIHSSFKLRQRKFSRMY